MREIALRIMEEKEIETFNENRTLGPEKYAQKCLWLHGKDFHGTNL